MMFRKAATQTLRRAAAAAQQHQHQLLEPSTRAGNTNRFLVTSAQKRALNKEQLHGGKDAASATTASSNSNSTTTPAAAAESSPSNANATTASTTSGTTSGGSGGGGGGAFLPLVGLTAVAAGGAYYMDLIPIDKLMGSSQSKVGTPVEAVEEKVVKQEPVASAVEEKAPSSKEVKKEPEKVVSTVKKDKKKAVAVAAKKEDKKEGGNRVLNIHVPPKSTQPKSTPAPVEDHPDGGNRVSIEKFSQIYTKTNTSNTTTNPAANEKKEELGASILEAKQELLASKQITSSKVDEALTLAHATMQATLDETLLKDLDKLSASQLRVRVVQLAAEMGERTKWEAIRLREFLGMKEKEVAERYQELMQKQRLEFEDLLHRRLREQEYNITKAANEAIESKDKSIESLVHAATSAQQAEHEATLQSTKSRLELELSAKYESEFGQKLAEAKAEFTTELEQKLANIQDLASRLQKNEQNLEISRNFETGSQRAHRVSAASLALAEKMESSKGAMEEFVALKAAAAENGVIASALEKIPASIKTGIPTLSELQTSFEYAYKIGRQAAYVPSGRSGLEGQFAGMLFASLTVPPSPDSLPPPSPESNDSSSDGKMSDYILAKAKRHVQLGELEQAVQVLDQLKGQVAFTINDWKVAASDRIAVDQTLKVIKMECALMNKNMGG